MGDAHDRAGIGNVPLRQRPQIQPQDCRPRYHARPRKSFILGQGPGIFPATGALRGNATSQRIALELQSQLLEEQQTPRRLRQKGPPLRSVPPFSSSILSQQRGLGCSEIGYRLGQGGGFLTQPCTLVSIPCQFRAFLRVTWTGQAAPRIIDGEELCARAT